MMIIKCSQRAEQKLGKVHGWGRPDLLFAPMLLYATVGAHPSAQVHAASEHACMFAGISRNVTSERLQMPQSDGDVGAHTTAPSAIKTAQPPSAAQGACQLHKLASCRGLSLIYCQRWSVGGIQGREGLQEQQLVPAGVRILVAAGCSQACMFGT